MVDRETGAGEYDVGGHALTVAARPIHSRLFAGEVRVHAADGKCLSTPVTIVVPGEWQTEMQARDAAVDYAALMARTGALRLAVRVRELARI